MSGTEFEIIERYFTGPISFSTEFVVLGPGDDCAILNIPKDHELLTSIDSLIEGVHFPRGANGEIVAHRSVCANLSDLAAMGAKPLAFTMAVTLPEEDSPWLKGFSTRLGQLVNQFEIPLVGGNLARGPLSVTISVMGVAPTGTAIQRTGALMNDEVYVTGTLGDAAGGLIVVNEKDASKQKPSDAFLLERYKFPTPRVALGVLLRGHATSAIDISDGLGADLSHLCEASGVGADIELASLPLSTHLKEKMGVKAAIELAVGSSDDYELCFTAPATERAHIESLARSSGVDITCIGKITDDIGIRLVDEKGQSSDLGTSGYQHFHEGEVGG